MKTIKERLFAMLSELGDIIYTKAEIKCCLDIIRNDVGGSCQYTYSLYAGNRWTRPGYLRRPSKYCPYYLESVRRGVYKVCKMQEFPIVKSEV